MEVNRHMFKLFFKSLSLGVKSSCAENRRILLFLVTLVLPGIAVGLLKTCISHFFAFDNNLLWLLIFIIAYVIAFILLANYLHFKDAKEYSKKHNISFEDAWYATKPDDEDCF